MAKARVLAVDDQRYFRELIEGLLTSEGYEVQTASSGEEALHVLELEDFDVVVTDLVMPGIDGCGLVERVKERDPDQEIVMVTGVVDVKTAVEAMKLGATDYILKPFDRKTLARSLEGILQRRRLREEHARLVAENLEYMEVLSLYERAHSLFATLRVEPLAQRLVEGLCLETRAQGGVLWLAEELGASRLSLTSARGLIQVAEEAEELDLDRLGPEFGALLEEGTPLLKPEGLFVPLRHAGELVGLARLTDRLEGSPFGDADSAAAGKFGSIGALALVNALRFRSLERRSFRDPTTKAYTHAYFEDVVRNEIQKANRFGRPFSIVRVDVGRLAELRRSAGESQLAHWLESLVHHVGQALRTTDLLAVEGENRFAVLLPETDALGAAVLKQRIKETIESSGVLDSIRSDVRCEVALAAASFPGDASQLEAIYRVLDQRLEEARGSLLAQLGLAGREFGEVVEALLVDADTEHPKVAQEAARFVLGEVARRPGDRGLLVVAADGEGWEVLNEPLAALAASESRTEVVLVAEEGASAGVAAGAITRVSPARCPTDCAFILYYGEGPAYTLVAEPKTGEAGLSYFHTSDRALVEHLAFELQRTLAIPLGA